MLKKCRNCGTTMRMEARYCPSCGKRDLIIFDLDVPDEISANDGSVDAEEMNKKSQKQGGDQALRTVSLRKGQQGESGQPSQDMKTVYRGSDEQTNCTQRERTTYQGKFYWPEEDTEPAEPAKSGRILRRFPVIALQFFWPEEDIEPAEPAKSGKILRRFSVIALLCAVVISYVVVILYLYLFY